MTRRVAYFVITVVVMLMGLLSRKFTFILSKNFDGGQVTFKGDAVICAFGMKSVSELGNELIENGYPVEIIGDAYKPRKILDAVHEGYHAGRRA